MFTHKDIEFRSIFVINCLEERSFKVQSGELLIKDSNTGKTLTKFPFQKILALFIIGHATITTPMIENCKKYNVYIAVMKPNLRPVFNYSTNAEANYLLRERQYSLDKNDLRIARNLIKNKISNQIKLLKNTRRKDSTTTYSIECCDEALELIDDTKTLKDLMGLAGWAAKMFFKAYYQDQSWNQRQPRVKCDVINVTLDIGYTILFNFIETYTRMFGFDLYRGVFHQVWFKRKSLICDLVEPFRCIIDRQVRKSFNQEQFTKSQFKLMKNEYVLKFNYTSLYYNTFCKALIDYKVDIFKFIQGYYRYFMNNNNTFPKFII